MPKDLTKIDDTILALLQLTLHDTNRAWKGFDWDVLDRLHAQGLIEDPKNASKSIVLTAAGLAKSRNLFSEIFAKTDHHGTE